MRAAASPAASAANPVGLRRGSYLDPRERRTPILRASVNNDPCWHLSTNIRIPTLPSPGSALPVMPVDEGGGGCLLQTFAGSFPRDEPPTLNFRALLTEGGAERLELARA